MCMPASPTANRTCSTASRCKSRPTTPSRPRRPCDRDRRPTGSTSRTIPRMTVSNATRCCDLGIHVHINPRGHRKTSTNILPQRNLLPRSKLACQYLDHPITGSTRKQAINPIPRHNIQNRRTVKTLHDRLHNLRRRKTYDLNHSALHRMIEIGHLPGINMTTPQRTGTTYVKLANVERPKTFPANITFLAIVRSTSVYVRGDRFVGLGPSCVNAKTGAKTESVMRCRTSGNSPARYQVRKILC
jgi:hypothetical protein